MARWRKKLSAEGLTRRGPRIDFRASGCPKKAGTLPRNASNQVHSPLDLGAGQYTRKSSCRVGGDAPETMPVARGNLATSHLFATDQTDLSESLSDFSICDPSRIPGNLSKVSKTEHTTPVIEDDAGQGIGVAGLKCGKSAPKAVASIQVSDSGLRCRPGCAACTALPF